MNLLIVLVMIWMGVGEPADVAAELENVTFEHMADPVQRWRPLVERYFPDDEVDTALCVIGHESGGDPRADNPSSTAAGLFQILGSTWAPYYGINPERLYEPQLNVRLASDIWGSSGWWAWSPYQRGVCH